MFVDTRASKHVETLLKYPNNCVLVTGPPGSGKSSLTRHIALDLKKYNDVEILPISEPADILCFHRSNKNQIFLMDDIYGNICLNSTLVDNWRTLINEIASIFNNEMQQNISNLQSESSDMGIMTLTQEKKKSSFRSILLMTSRLHVYKEVDLNPVGQLWLQLCNITDGDICLTMEERLSLVHTYLQEYEHAGLEKMRVPTIFRFYVNLQEDYGSKTSVCNFFLTPTSSIKNDVNTMKTQNKAKFCCLCLCVMFEDSLPESLLCNTVSCHDADIELKLKSVMNVLDFKYENEIHRRLIRANMEILKNSYLKHLDGFCSFIHNTFYELCSKICGEYIFETFVNYGSSTFLAKRYISQTCDQSSTNTLFIEIPPCHKQTYFNRLKSDLAKGDVISSFYNHQLSYESFSDQFASRATK